MRQVNEINIAAQSAASVNGGAVPALNLFKASVQMVCTGAAAGTLVLQASNDDLTTLPGSAQVPTNWTNIPSATVSISGAGTYLIPATDICYQYIRASYTNSGSGTIAVVIKALGA